jgi:hypothetical protein
MSSKIMPCAIFLGTTSLGTFLSLCAFGNSDSTTVDEVHRVFTVLSKEDLCFRTKATTGLMGALGRRLGRLPLI